MNTISNDILSRKNSNYGVIRLTLNDPENKNSLSEAMIEELINQISNASKDNSVKVIIIDSVGTVFCSGHNLKEINDARNKDDNGESYFFNLFDRCSFLMQLITNCSIPVIAQVNGIATAAGCQLVASCDLAISSDTSKFATPGVNIGLFCSTPMVALSRNMNKKDAMKMLLTGEMIDASEAKRISLINDYTSENNLSEYVDNLAKEITKKSRRVIKHGKEAFYKQLDKNLSDAYIYTSKIMAKNVLKDDAIEGINAFLDKRDPSWKD